MIGIRDIEQLSAYLDGQLSPSDSVRLETRLRSDPQLTEALQDLRYSRTLLRQLPARKAPRNFILTRKMVGARPPLPRTYPFFRLSSAFASLMLMLTFAFNFVAPRMTAANIPLPFGGSGGGYGGGPAFGMSGGGGGGCAEPCGFAPPVMAPAATEAPIATEAPAEAASEPVMEMTMPTEGAMQQEAAGNTGPAPEGDIPTAKEGESAPETPAQPVTQQGATLIPSVWQFVLLVVALASLLAMFVMRQLAARKWK